ncbi:MAG: xylulokinase [Lachnospiraceae bacterium]|nr:xylulokinase [Lachnospiraceae bacterium]
MKDYIIAHDLGTSGNKATLYRTDGTLIASTLFTYETYYPHPGWVEQKPEEWWQAVCGSTKALMEKAGIRPSQIAAISFSAQMMGCLLVDRAGNALRPMLIWADTRAGKQEKEMIEKLGMERVYQITGHRASASYSAAKLLWIRENEPEIYGKAYKMIHAKDYIICRLTGEFATDYSDASGTNLFDIVEKRWSQEILQALQIPEELLPTAYPSTHVVGGIRKEEAEQMGLVEGTPVVLGGGDGSCACVGAGAVMEGHAYNVLGSSSWISIASKSPVFDQQMRTFNWVHLDEHLYTPCGTMQAAGYSYNWYRNTLCQEERREAAEQGCSAYQLIDQGVEACPPGANGVMFLPYLLGERSPRWNHEARGSFIGMGISTTKGELSRAVLEGVGFNLKVILDILEEKTNIEQLTLIGGGAKGKVWAQILADIWQKPLVLPRFQEEATSMGAAVCAGVGIGIYRNFQSVSLFNQGSSTIKPRTEYADQYHSLYEIFNHAYEQMVPIYHELAEYNHLI